MKLAQVALCTVLVLVALPASSSAQFMERWSANAALGPTTLSPNNLGDIDHDSQADLIVSFNTGSGYAVQIRDPATGAIKFTSTTKASNPWTIYLLDTNNDLIKDAVLAAAGGPVDPWEMLMITYGGSVSAPASVAPGVGEALLPARPNPFASQVSLAYTLTVPGKAELEIYDVAGRLVRRLGGDRQEAGEHRVEWDGRDSGGRALDAGMYFYRLNVDGRTSEARKTIRLGQ